MQFPFLLENERYKFLQINGQNISAIPLSVCKLKSNNNN